MPASPNAFKNRSGKAKKGKAIVKTSNARLQWDVPKPPSPGDPIGSSWGDAGPSWGDAAPSWGDADIPVDNQPSQPSSGSVWDNPALEPKEETTPAAETSEWGNGEWIYPAPSTNEETSWGGGAAGSQDNPVNEHQDNHNSENTGWGDGEWVGWGDGAAAADSTTTAGWNDSYGTNPHPDQQYYPHDYQAAGEYGESWGPSYDASTSWIGQPNDDDPTYPNGSDAASPVKALSDFRLNPTATTFIPKSIIPPPMIIEVHSEAENSPYTVAATAELEPEPEPEPEPSTGPTPITATDSIGTTPSTATDSFPQNSTPDLGTSSTPATCLADADSQTEDVAEKLLRVNLEVAEFTLEVSKANLDVKMAALEAMKAKLEVMKQKRALLAASAARDNNLAAI